MKKAVSVILVLVLCLSLCACGRKTTDAYIGKWETEDEGYYKYNMEVKADNTGVLTMAGETENFTWVFDDYTRTLVLTSENGVVRELVYLEVNDSLTSAGVRFVRDDGEE